MCDLLISVISSNLIYFIYLFIIRMSGDPTQKAIMILNNINQNISIFSESNKEKIAKEFSELKVRISSYYQSNFLLYLLQL